MKAPPRHRSVRRNARRFVRFVAGRPRRACVAALLALSALGCLAGCGGGGSAADRLKQEGFMERNPPGVPPEAKLVRHSERAGGGGLSPDAWFSNEEINFRPTQPGQVWVVDEQNAAIVFRGRMKGGDKLIVAPKTNDILLNKATVYHRRLPEDHGFLIYFAADPQDAQSSKQNNPPPPPTAPGVGTSDTAGPGGGGVK